MELKWPNVFAFGLTIGAVVLAVRNRREVSAALASIGHIGPGFSPEEQTLGLCVLGVLCVAGVAIVRLVIHGNRRDDP